MQLSVERWAPVLLSCRRGWVATAGMVALGVLSGCSPKPSEGPVASGAASGAAAAVRFELQFSPYKDVTIGTNWATGEMQTPVLDERRPLAHVLPPKARQLTWAFATGECGHETWGVMDASRFAKANVQKAVEAGLYYTVGTGGALGAFTCSTDEGFFTFLKRYDSPNFLGVDFDIELNQTQAELDNLVKRAVAAQDRWPHLRFSFTIPALASNLGRGMVATELGADAPDPFTPLGQRVMKALRGSGLRNFTVDLQATDYGPPRAGQCVAGPNRLCQMGQSAVQAAMNVHAFYKLPYSQIELAPMIGGNDSAEQVFTLEDVDTISAFIVKNNLAGVRMWSFDRDKDCAPGPAQDSCNSFGKAGPLGFTMRFIEKLKLQ